MSEQDELERHNNELRVQHEHELALEQRDEAGAMSEPTLFEAWNLLADPRMYSGAPAPFVSDRDDILYCPWCESEEFSHDDGCPWVAVEKAAEREPAKQAAADEAYESCDRYRAKFLHERNELMSKLAKKEAECERLMSERDELRELVREALPHVVVASCGYRKKEHERDADALVERMRKAVGE